MDKSTFSPQYELLRRRLVDLRHEAGLTQRELADKLKREHSFVARIELGERRVDLVEFCWICEALGADPRATADQLIDAMPRYDRRRGPAVVRRRKN